MEQNAFPLRIGNWAIALLATAFLGGCLSDEKDGTASPLPFQQPTNSAPQISGAPVTNVEVGTAYSFTPSATDADGDVLTFSVSNRPSWASFDPASGRLSGTPTLGDVGTVAGIAISVSDGNDAAALAAFSITVTMTDTNMAPQISGTPSASVNVGSSYSFTPTASDPDGDALTFSISNLPAWATFSAATGTLSGTPDNGDVGTYNGISIAVSDGEFSATLPAFGIAVNAVVGNSPPQISGTPSASVEVGNSYSFTPTASDPDGDALTFSISNLPAWATFSTANGTLSGTPGSGDVGTYSGISIAVSDGEFSANLPAFAINVSEVVSNSPPQISGTPAASVNEGQAYSFTPVATDADGDTLTFSISGQPSWASFDATTGSITGTPSAADVGTYTNIVISVSDGQVSASLPAFSISVEAISLGSATLSWTAPTLNEDGTPLTDLAGYKLYWGTEPGNYPNFVTIDNPSVTTYVVDNLAPGTYEFAATSYNEEGVESRYSGTATKTIP